MSHTTLHALVQSLQTKVDQLLARHAAQEATIQRLQEENVQLKADKASSVPTLPLGVLHEKGPQGSTAWQAQIDGYIQDIDRCIEHLEQLP